MKRDFKIGDELILISIRSITATGENEFNIGLAERNLREMIVKAKYLDYISNDTLLRSLHADIVKIKIKGVELLINKNVTQYNGVITVGDHYYIGRKCRSGVFKGINKNETFKYIWGVELNESSEKILYKGFMEYEYLKRVLTSRSVKNREFTNQFIAMLEEIINNSVYT